LNQEFVKTLEKRLKLTFQPAGESDLATTFGPKDIFHYIYTIFHSPGYRSRYEQFLKIDFPKVPLPASTTQFKKLCKLGRELVALHLLESPAVSSFTTSFPQPGDNLIAKGYPKFVPPQNEKPGRIRINKDQYVDGVNSEAWGFHIGGYQVLAKWLKDRRGRRLTYQDLTHYQKIIVALQETIKLMQKIDEIVSFPMVK
jgi:predicted helicase